MADDADPVVDPVVPPADLPAEPQPRPQMVPVAVVADLREKKRGLESQVETLQRQLAESTALNERLAKQSPTPNNPNPNPPPAAPPVNQNPLANDVERRAAEIVINRDIATVNQAGMKSFGAQWNNDVNALTAYGVNTPDFLVSVIELDRGNAHQIMHDIAQDGEKAVALAAMSPTARAAEIARMMMAKSAAPTADPPRNPDGTFSSTPPAAPPAPTRQVSRAPAPPPPVTPSASKEVDWRSDDADDDTFNKGWDEMASKRWGNSRMVGPRG